MRPGRAGVGAEAADGAGPGVLDLRGAAGGGDGGRHPGRARRPHQGGAPGARALTMSRWSDPAVAERILREYHTWAVVGCSPNPWRASHGVSRFLMSQGYEIVPIYPRPVEIHGRQAHRDLESAARDHPIEVVDIFRAAHRAGRRLSPRARGGTGAQRRPAPQLVLALRRDGPGVDATGCPDRALPPRLRRSLADGRRTRLGGGPVLPSGGRAALQTTFPWKPA